MTKQEYRIIDGICSRKTYGYGSFIPLYIFGFL